MNSNNVHPVRALVLVTLAAASASFCLNTVPPVAPELMRAWRINESQVGLLMSVFNITGLLLALPGSLVIGRIGVWSSGLWALAAVFLGSALGLVSTDFTVQVASRVVQGVGMALMALLGPTIVGQLFAPQRRGMAMGVFTTFMALGQLVMFNVGPWAVALWGWPSLWIGTTLYSLVFLVLWAFGLQNLRSNGVSEVTQGPPMQAPSLSAMFRNRAVVGLATTMGLFMASFLTLMFFLPTYLAAARGVPLAEASTLASVGALVATVVALTAGGLLDRLGSRPQVAALCLIAVALMIAAVPFLPTPLMWIPIVVLGVFPSLAGINILSATTEAVPHHQAGLAIGVVTFGQNLGMVVGPLAFGAAIQGLGWTMAIAGLATVCLLAAGMVLTSRRTGR